MTAGWLGRLPVGTKVVAAFLLTVAVTTAPWPATGAVVAAAVIICAVTARLRWSTVLRPIVPTVIGVAMVISYHLIWSDGRTAMRVGGMLFALAVTSAVLIACTPAEATVDWAVTASRHVSGPLAMLRLSPEVIGVAFGLTMATAPALVETVTEVRAAAAARGIRSARVWLVPVVVRAMTRAQRSAEALAARGVLDIPTNQRRDVMAPVSPA